MPFLSITAIPNHSQFDHMNEKLVTVEGVKIGFANQRAPCQNH
jgi:hypothetical protein